MDPDERPQIGLSIEDQFAEWQAKRQQQATPSAEALTEEGTKGGPLVSTARGLGRAANGVYGLVDSFGKFGARQSGLYKLFRDDEEEKAWLEEAEETSGETLLNIAERPGGFWGFYEGAVQFVAGFVPGMQATKAAGITNVLARGAVAGAAADFSVWDPQEERLANLVQHGPSWIQNPVTDYLAADEDDGELEGRFKSALEGLMLGTTIDALFTGIRFLKIGRDLRAGRITPEVAAERRASALGHVSEAVEDGPVSLRDNPDGTVELTFANRTRRRLAEVVDPSVRRELDEAFTDPISGLSNQTAFQRAKPRLEADPGTELVIFDLDNFKALNDNQGLEAGDAVLREVGDLLQQHSGVDARNLFRAGGDEFIVAAPKGQGDQIGQAVKDAFGSRPVEGTEFAVSARYGVGDTFQAADEAASGAKAKDPQARARDVVADPTLSDKAQRVVSGEGDSVTLPNRVEGERAAASLNMIHRLNKRPAAGVSLDSSQRGAVLKVAQRIRDGVDPDDVEALAEGIDFNFHRVTSPEEGRSMLNALSEVLREAFQGRTNRAAEGLGRTHADVLKSAENLIPGVSGGEMIQHLNALRGVTEALPETVLGARIMLHGHAQRVSGISRVVDLDPTNVLAVRQLAEEMDGLGNLALEVAGVGSDLGRALNSMKIEVSDEALGAIREKAGSSAAVKPSLRQPRFSQAFRKNKFTAGELSSIARTLQLTHGDPESVLRALKLVSKASADPAERSVWDHIISFRVSMMLSGVRTQVVNAVSATMAAVQVPAEVMVGGALTGNKVVARQGYDMLVSPLANGGLILSDAASAFRKAFRQGESLLDPQYMKDEHGMLKTFTDPQAGLLIQVLSLPGRGLVAVDEFVKRTAYLSHVRSQSLRNLRQEALENGYQWTPAEIGNRVADDLAHAVDEDGAARTWFNSLQHAREVTFTNKLNAGTFGHGLQEMANTNPVVRFIVPFVRTPVNIFRFAHQRFPVLGLATREMRDMWKAGGDQRAIVVGRQAAGAFAYSMGAYLAHQGLMTGKGPSNPQLRAQLLEAGWQPYSVKVPGGWMSYRRLEPIATPLAITADAVEMMGELGEEGLEEVSTAIMAAMTASVSSKSFLLGITEFFDAIGSGEEHKTERFITSAITSFLPALTRQANPDPIWREMNGYIESLAGALPGFSTRLEPRRNLFGEPVVRSSRQAFNTTTGYLNTAFNPFTIVSSKGIDDIQMELAGLGKAMPMPSETRAEGRINLRDRNQWSNRDPKRANQSPYDRMMELVSTGGLRDRLTTLMRSDRWKGMGTGTETYAGGEKWLVASQLVRAHVARAEAEMLREYPDLRRALTNDQRARVEAIFAR